MSLLQVVCTYLEERNLLAAVIGAYALSAHGIARATQDIDLLMVEPQVLRPDFWSDLNPDVEIEIRHGESDDPLGGVVRLVQGDEEVEVIVGKQAWMRPMLDRRISLQVRGETLSVVDAADLVLLKLFAAGPQDKVDTQLLLEGHGDKLRREVERRLADLPAEMRTVWTEVSRQT